MINKKALGSVVENEEPKVPTNRILAFLGGLAKITWRALSLKKSDKDPKIIDLDLDQMIGHYKGQILPSSVRLEEVRIRKSNGHLSRRTKVQIKVYFSPTTEQCVDRGIMNGMVFPRAFLLEIVAQAVMAAVTHHLELDETQQLVLEQVNAEWFGELYATFRLEVTVLGVQLEVTNKRKPSNGDSVLATDIVGAVGGVPIVVVHSMLLTITEHHFDKKVE